MTESEKELKVVEVVPIMRGITRPSLSYFTREDLNVGSFVKIPVRNSGIPGLVVGISNAKAAKTDLKRASFALKKLSKSSESSLSPAFVRAAEKTAKYYATTVGNILGAILGKVFLENPNLINSGIANDKKINTPKEILLIQLNDEERFREYKSLIRESFARGESILFCVPTHEEALRSYDFLSKGIANYAFVTSGKTPNKLKETLKQAIKEKHPILFITTPSFIAFNRKDLKTIILERENSRAYQTLSRPFINIKIFLENLSKESNLTLILGDSVLSIESLWQEKHGRYAELSPIKWRTSRHSDSQLVDMKLQIETSKFEIFSKELKDLITKAISEKRKIFLFSLRKGFSPSTVCQDCGSILSCENCGAPLVLHSSAKNGRIYICHACTAKRPAEIRCDTCQSWNLVPLGVGIDRVAEEVREMFPDTPIFILDKEHAPTAKKAGIIAKKFAEEKGGIILGTELAFLYLEKVPYAGLISLDSLFSIPDFSIHERIFYLVTRLLEISEVETIIQTRNIGKEVLSLAEQGNILDFYRTEIAEREELKYPPFSIFIKVTSESTQKDIEKKTTYLKSSFIEYEPNIIHGRGMKTGHFTVSMILRLSRESWPKTELSDKLLLLPPDFSIKVDPESIL